MAHAQCLVSCSPTVNPLLPFRDLTASSPPGGAAAAVWHTRVVERCVSRLLAVAVADSSERVRKEVLRALVATTALDDYLAQVGVWLSKGCVY